ncbi:hypothetical protein BS78_K156400 [Paspalum vaginatum]|uniref:Uncharacterized protein n=1 Tax=Paspalum vaginatum TaxID=158149 RepID=A0A9W7X7T4_9POAL|nr:hypothetical protein BS78_K156400 [Paspalum vaginatum]
MSQSIVLSRPRAPRPPSAGRRIWLISRAPPPARAPRRKRPAAGSGSSAGLLRLQGAPRRKRRPISWIHHQVSPSPLGLLCI